MRSLVGPLERRNCPVTAGSQANSVYVIQLGFEIRQQQLVEAIVRLPVIIECYEGQ